MTTISKFYLLDAATPNTGTMPSGALILDTNAGVTAVTGDAATARTARDATDVAGASNPDIETTITSTANTSAQSWGHRRFVSRPLAVQTINVNSGNWTFSYARQESNLLHNQIVIASVYVWRPSTGARIGGNGGTSIVGTEPTVAATVQAESVTAIWSGANVTLADGDILVFDVVTNFTQGMATAYTDSFEYDGTTEASITTCASFVTPPAALTLFTAAAATSLPAQRRNTMTMPWIGPIVDW